MKRIAPSLLAIASVLSFSSLAYAAEGDGVPASYQPRAAIPLDRHGAPRVTFPADEELSPPVGYKLEHRPIAGLIYGGIGAVAGGYGLSAMVIGFDYLGSHGDGPWAYALIPVAGPLIAAAVDPDSLATGFYVASGVVQNLGVAMIIIGATVERPFFTAVSTASGPISLGFGPGSFSLSGRFE